MQGKGVVERIMIGRRRLVYERAGEGPPLLLVHGLSGSARWWRRNIPAFAPHFTVYAVDLVGFGGNRGRGPLPLQEAAHLLAAFVEQLGAGPADVIGHSMGGHIATYLAAEHPAAVRRLVLAAASGLVQEPIMRMAARLPRVARRTDPGFTGTLMWDAARAGAINLVLAARELLADDVTAFLQRISTPTLVLSGEHDLLIPPAAGAAQHAAIHGSQYAILPGAGHIVMWDQAEHFNQLVLAFLLAEPPRSSFSSRQRRHA